MADQERAEERESDLTWENVAKAVEDAPRVLAALRNTYCTSLRDTAALAGVDFNTLHRFEHGRVVTTRNLVKILRYLGEAAGGDE